MALDTELGSTEPAEIKGVGAVVPSSEVSLFQSVRKLVFLRDFTVVFKTLSHPQPRTINKCVPLSIHSALMLLTAGARRRSIHSTNTCWNDQPCLRTWVAIVNEVDTVLSSERLLCGQKSPRLVIRRQAFESSLPLLPLQASPYL